MLWVYHGFRKWTKGFELAGRRTTPDRNEGMFTLPTRDEASDRNLHPVVPDKVYQSHPSRTIAAILPVTTSSLPRLSEYLFGLSTIPYLSEVYLLCPENIADLVSHSLRQTLSRTQGFGHTEFFVTLRRDELSAAESALQVASSLLSNRTLILPQDGLAGIDSASRNILLSRPPSLPVPLGLRGSEASCGTEFQGFTAARFVSPPLLLPSRLRATNTSYFNLTSWEELGAHFTRAEGVGGVVPPTTLENADSCHDLNASETATLDLERSYPPPGSLDSHASLVILIAEGEDVPALWKLACEFQSRGTEVKVATHGIPSDSIYPVGEGCDVSVTNLDSQHPTFPQLFDNSPGVFLTLVEYRPLPESLLEATARETVIHIPRRDLPHCDWIASLGAWELRSERLSESHPFGMF